jgi:precorrin-4/cobalt-precorrin-4 C11-methyltransferase
MPHPPESLPPKPPDFFLPPGRTDHRTRGGRGGIDFMNERVIATAPGTVWFVGAGPGDPELITVKGRGLIERAGAILFAGSLVSEATTRWAPAGCVVADSKDMTLEQMSTWLIAQAARCETVVRLQTGDPGLYGALIELVQPLDAAGVPIAVVPGVSSAMASAAAAVESLTLPEVTQTVIFTRVEGLTPMPEGESLEGLAAHHSTLCIFLSITLMGKVTAALLAAGWSPDAPMVVVHKASWPGEEKIVRGTVATIQALCREARIVSQSMIIASPNLGARQWTTLAKSKLYDASFTHRFRRASVPAADLVQDTP